MTYGSEIWISDLNIKLDNIHVLPFEKAQNNIHVLPFEKAQNMMMKNILGVHGKTSNLDLHAELGLFPLCFKAFKLEEDKQLFNHNNTRWVKSVFQMKNLFNLPSLDISYSDFLEKIKLTYTKKIFQMK